MNIDNEGYYEEVDTMRLKSFYIKMDRGRITTVQGNGKDWHGWTLSIRDLQKYALSLGYFRKGIYVIITRDYIKWLELKKEGLK